MAIPPLVLRIVADSTGVAAGVAQTQSRIGRMRGFLQRNSMLIKGALIGGVVVGLAKSVGAAREAALAQAKLANSVKNSTKVSKDAVKGFMAQAEALRDLTGVDDEAIEGAQAVLVSMKLTEDQVKALTPRVVDLSEKMGIDLEAAAKAVGKSVNGSVGGLQRMAVVVDKAKAATDPYAATLEALSAAQGFAAKSARLEPWKKIGAQFEELTETIGTALLPVIRAVFNWINDKAIPWIKNMGSALREKLGPPLGRFWQVLKNDVWPALKNVWDLIRPVAKFVGGALVLAFQGAIEVLSAVAQWLSQVADGIQHVLDLWNKLPFTNGSGRTDVGDQPGLPENQQGGVNPFNPFGRQHGGWASAGRLYRVNEVGREYFRPATSGTIVPVGEGSPPVVNVYIGEEKVEGIVIKALNRAAART